MKAFRAAKNKAKASKLIGGDGVSIDRAVERATESAVKAMRAEAARCAHIDAIAGDEHRELAAKAKADGTPAKDFELTVLRSNRSFPSGASTKEEGDESELFEAALLVNTGFDQALMKKYFDEKTMNVALSSRFRGFSMVELADRLIQRAGIPYRGMRKQTGHMEAYRSAENKLRASGFTSMTLSSILENAADKVLLNQYQAVETQWQKLCSVRSLNDFKVHSQYALDPLSVFQEVSPEGDFSNLQFSDRKYSLQANSYGTRFKIDFQTWRNDDLGSINDRIGSLGMLSAQTIEMVLHMLLLQGINNSALFHANNKNYLYGANAAFSFAGLTAAESLWDNQVRQNGTPLGISPQMLLVPTTLKAPANQLFTSSKLNEVFTTAQTRTGPVGSDNNYQGKYQPVVDPYLNNTLIKYSVGRGPAVSFPKQDSGFWFLFARQGNIAPLHIGFLDGQQTPKVEIIQNQSEMIGFELAAAMHFGVGYGDPKLASCFDPNNVGGN
jgi:hypothetical protein